MKGWSQRATWRASAIAAATALVVCEGARGDPPPPSPSPDRGGALARPADAGAGGVGSSSPPSAVAIAIELGDLSRARGLLESAPPGLARDLALGRVLLDLGENRAAAEALGRVGDRLPEVDDRVRLWRAEAKLAAGDAAGAAREAGELLRLHPQSRRAVRARVLRARAVARTGPPADAVRLLTELLDGAAAAGIDRPALRAELARAREASGDAAGAAQDWRRLAVQAPEHPSARQALEALARLDAAHPLTAAERVQRAERLLERKRWALVVLELDAIGPRPSGVREMRLTWLRGVALHRERGADAQAAALLAKVARSVGPEAEEAVFLHARTLARLNRDAEAARALARFAKQHPQSKRADDARLTALTMDLDRGRRAAGAQLVALAASTQDAAIATQARFRAALANLYAGRPRAAVPALDAIAAAVPGTSEARRAVYWGAVARLGAKRQPAAVTALQRVIAEDPLSFYGLMARQRLAALEVPPPPPFGRAIVADAEPAIAAIEPPTPAARTLLAVGLTREAGEEIAQAAEGRSRDDQIALYGLARATERLCRLAKTAMSADLERPPVGAARRAWALAYPRPYRAVVEAEAGAAQVPATLVWAVMRQESSFDPEVVSYANAHGLMQLLPRTAERVASELGQPFDPSLLARPMHNIRLGARYLGALLRRFRGQAPLAIAAYNGGPGSVDRWLAAFGDRPTDEFIERIPFDQTHNYVRRVLAAWGRYRYLYDGTGAWPLEIGLTIDRRRGAGPQY